MIVVDNNLRLISSLIADDQKKVVIAEHHNRTSHGSHPRSLLLLKQCHNSERQLLKKHIFQSEKYNTREPREAAIMKSEREKKYERAWP